MKIAIFSAVITAVIVTGCATPESGQWHNKLYERDYNTSMRKYYGRDFNICLGIAVEATTAGPGNRGAVERNTDKCLRDSGWVQIR